jgi:hypothetical protein
LSNPPIPLGRILMGRYRYEVARLTPGYLAMSLPMCPSAFIRFVVVMRSASSTLRADRTWCRSHGMRPLEGGSLLTLLALAKQSVISKHLGPRRSYQQPSG